MHFVTGGAFHGKKQAVIDYYQINEARKCFWFNGYKDGKNLYQVVARLENNHLLVVEAADQIIVEMLELEDNVYVTFENWLEEILMWEQKEVWRQVVIIGTDIGKGVVPIEKQQRLIRDEVGRAFQLLASKATKVSLIWYGLQQKLK